MTGPRDIGCRALVAAFVARRIELAEFLRRFDRLWPGAAPHGNATAGLAAIRTLCGAYSSALPCGAGYRVSEAQLRLEIRCLLAASAGRPGAAVARRDRPARRAR